MYSAVVVQDRRFDAQEPILNKLTLHVEFIQPVSKSLIVQQFALRNRIYFKLCTFVKYQNIIYLQNCPEQHTGWGALKEQNH